MEASHDVNLQPKVWVWWWDFDKSPWDDIIGGGEMCRPCNPMPRRELMMWEQRNYCKAWLIDEHHSFSTVCEMQFTG